MRTRLVHPIVSKIDLEASYPICPNATSYFPIRRAANNSQCTLGRAFLRDAYVVADYERSNFSIHQVVFDSQAQNIVAIHAPNSTLIDTSPKKHKFLSAGAITGIVIGAVATVALLGPLAWFFCCGKKPKGSEHGLGEEQMEERPVEYYQDEMQRKPLYEMEQTIDPNSAKFGESHTELDSSGICLMSDDTQQHELPG